MDSQTPLWNKILSSAAGVVAIGLWATAVGSGGDMSAVIPLLFTAWVVSSLGIGTYQGWQATSRTFGIIGVGVLFLLTAVYVTYWHLSAPGLVTNALDNLVISGAELEVTPEGPEKLKDGNYSFPIITTNIGDSDVINFDSRFGQSVTDHVLTREEEDSKFNSLVGDVFYAAIKDQHLKEKWITDIVNIIHKGDSKKINQQTTMTKEVVDLIMKNKIFLYNFLVIRYTDRSSFADNRYYYGEHCARYIPNFDSAASCSVHNVTKRREK